MEFLSRGDKTPNVTKKLVFRRRQQYKKGEMHYTGKANENFNRVRVTKTL